MQKKNKKGMSGKKSTKTMNVCTIVKKNNFYVTAQGLRRDIRSLKRDCLLIKNLLIIRRFTAVSHHLRQRREQNFGFKGFFQVLNRYSLLKKCIFFFSEHSKHFFYLQLAFLATGEGGVGDAIFFYVLPYPSRSFNLMR